VEKYRVRHRKPPSPTWRSFLKNHVTELISIDFFTVPTVGFKVLFVLLVLAHDMRRVVHFNITENPTAQWTAQQIVGFCRKVSRLDILPVNTQTAKQR